MTLNRVALLAASDVASQTEDVDVPEWEGTIRVRAITAGELPDFQDFVGVTGEDGEVEVDSSAFGHKLVCWCVVEENGERAFKNEEWELIKKWPGKVFQRVFNKAAEMNGYDSGN